MSTDFSKRVYAWVRKIPEGKVATYGQIALLCEKPGAARAVGRLMSRCAAEEIPCHRVVKHDGGLCHDQDFGCMQSALLQKENVQFLQNGRVDLTISLWSPSI